MIAGRMPCVEALTVLTDREHAHANDVRAAERHLDECPACASLSAGDLELPFPIATRRRSWRRRAAFALAVLAIVQLLIALPWLVGVNVVRFVSDGASHDHLTRDGAFGLLLGTAGLLTAWRPRYAMPMFFLCCASLPGQLLGLAVDEHDAKVHLSFEFMHVVGLAIVALVAVQAFHRPTPRHSPRRPPKLRSVD